MGIQFLPKSVILDDTEGPLCTLVSKTLVFSEFTTVHRGFLNENTNNITGNKKAVLPQGNRAMLQVFFSVEVRQQHSLQV